MEPDTAAAAHRSRWRVLANSRREGLHLRLALLTIWLGIVAVLSYGHVPWRDEVRALSIAQDAHGLAGLFEGLRYEGHPILWHLLLAIAYNVFHTPAVLKLVSVAVAFTGAAVFLFCAPFPLWFRAMFLFSGLPLYEYSVMARNYGISMLLLFAFGAVYCGKRRNPFVLGAILFLLANTNAHSALLTCLLLPVLIAGASRSRAARGETQAPKRLSPGGCALAVGFAMAGVLLCAATVGRSRDENMVGGQRPVSRVVPVLLNAVAGVGGRFQTITGMDSLSTGIKRLSRGAAIRPGIQVLMSAFAYMLLLASIAGLLRRPFLALIALAALWGMAGFFALIYPGVYRHQGLWLVFALTLYWLAATEISRQESWWAGRLHRVSFRIALPALFLLNILMGAYKITVDIRSPYSSSRDFAAVLSAHEELQSATVIGEPEFMVDALPYYIRNRIYLQRSARFGKVFVWLRHQKLHMSLSEILDAAYRVRQETARPVVLLMQPRLDRPIPDLQYNYGFSFSCDQPELDEFHAATRQIAALHRASSDENYDVYVLN